MNRNKTKNNKTLKYEQKYELNYKNINKTKKHE